MSLYNFTKIIYFSLTEPSNAINGLQNVLETFEAGYFIKEPPINEDFLGIIFELVVEQPYEHYKQQLIEKFKKKSNKTREERLKLKRQHKK